MSAEIAPELGGQVRYGGHVCAAVLASEMVRVSVFLFTSCWDEPFWLMAIEAMACRLPVASLDCGAAREVIAEAGVFAPANDAQAFAAAIPQALVIRRDVPHKRVIELFTREMWLDNCKRPYRSARSVPVT